MIAPFIAWLALLFIVISVVGASYVVYFLLAYFGRQADEN